MKQGAILGFAGRRDRLESAVQLAFDLPQMTRLAVGPRWGSMSAEQHAELVKAFGDYSAATYADRFNHDSGERFEVSPNVTQTSDGAIVHTKLVRTNDKPVQLGYLMRLTAAGWKIEDVYLSGTISELATRRSEFASILRTRGIDGLIAMLNTKANSLSARAS